MHSSQPKVLPGGEPRRLGKYELIARIGEGGMAEVHLARMRGPMNFRKVVVVKTIHPSLASQEQFLKMLFDEARVSALIRHPRVVDIYDLGHAGGTYFIAMEYLDGQPLSAIMSAGARGTPLDVFSTARIVADAAEGLHAAHELKSISGKSMELVHRDVSPGNVIVLYDGNVKLVDFGIAKARGRLTESGVRQLKGKAGYMSPEQIAGRPVDRRSDVYSLGVVLWEALALRRLFPGGADESTIDQMLRGAIPPPTSPRRHHVPAELAEVCRRALAADPGERYQTAGEMKDALETLLRAAGYYRESDSIRVYMARTFARRRAERNELIRARATTTSENEALTFDAHADDGPEIVVEQTMETGPDGAAGAREVTPATAASPAPPASRKRSRAPWILAGAAVAGAVVAVALFPRGEEAARAGAEAAEGERAQPRLRTPQPQPARQPQSAPQREPEPQARPQPEGEVHGRTPVARRTEAKAPIAKPTRSAEELYDEGAALFVQGKAEQARQRFAEAVRANPGHAPSHRGLGMAYQSLGNEPKAIAAFEKYLRLRPDAEDAESIRARIDKMRR